MAVLPFIKPAVRIVVILLLLYAALVAFVLFRQRSLLYFPSHETINGGLVPWREGGQVIGYCREVARPKTVWLMMHGNAGQAAYRDYVLPRMSSEDSLYVLEYPGYGDRPGSPSRQSIDQAAVEAYRLLRAKFPHTPVGVLAESIGSGPACMLAGEKTPPDKLVLIVPFDVLADVAAEHFPILPARLLLRDRWDNVAALANYRGPVDIYGAKDDVIIPEGHARALAEKVPQARFVEISGGHNDWSECDRVKIRIAE